MHSSQKSDDTEVVPPSAGVAIRLMRLLLGGTCSVGSDESPLTSRTTRRSSLHRPAWPFAWCVSCLEGPALSGPMNLLSQVGRHGGRPSIGSIGAFFLIARVGVFPHGFLMDEIGRRHPAHWPAHEGYNAPVMVFLTVCTSGRKPVLANPEAHEVLRSAWGMGGTWTVGRYVIMPEHVHLFCAPAEFPPRPLREWVRFWKSHAARHWPRREDAPLWQRDFWDTQLRRSENYSEKWEYVSANPVRAGLVENPQDWPYQGTMNLLMW